jgi:hypothetical protein
VPTVFLCVEETFAGKSGGAILEVQVTERSPISRDSRIEIRLRNGRSLVVEQGFDTEQVRALLAVAETAE